MKKDIFIPNIAKFHTKRIYHNGFVPFQAEKKNCKMQISGFIYNVCKA